MFWLGGVVWVYSRCGADLCNIRFHTGEEESDKTSKLFLTAFYSDHEVWIFVYFFFSFLSFLGEGGGGGRGGGEGCRFCPLDGDWFAAWRHVLCCRWSGVKCSGQVKNKMSTSDLSFACLAWLYQLFVGTLILLTNAYAGCSTPTLSVPTAKPRDLVTVGHSVYADYKRQTV